MHKTFKSLRDLVKGDGCTASPELWYHESCLEHDKDYTTHRDEFGALLTRSKADARFLKNMKKASPNWLIRYTLPYLYYFAVRIFGATHWDK